MKTIKRAIQVLACTAYAIAVAPSASAEIKPGFYIGASAVKSSYDIDKADLDDIVLDAFFAAGAPVISGASTFEDSDTSASIFLGYRFIPYLAVEVGYVDLGTAEYRSTGRVNPPGPVTSAASAANIDVATKGFTVSGIGILPIGDHFDLHGRLGLYVAKTDISVGVTIASTVSAESDSTDSASALFGVGAGLNLGEHFSLSLDWTRYANVADGNDDDDFETEEGFDIDGLSLSAIFRF